MSQSYDVIMSAVASQITSVSIVCSTVGSGTNQRKHQSSVSLAFVRGIHWWPVNSAHKGPVTRKMFPFLMTSSCTSWTNWTQSVGSVLCTLYISFCNITYNMLYIHVHTMEPPYITTISLINWHTTHMSFVTSWSDLYPTFVSIQKHCHKGFFGAIHHHIATLAKMILKQIFICKLLTN